MGNQLSLSYYTAGWSCSWWCGIVLLTLLGLPAALRAGDAGDTYVLAQAAPSMPGLVAESMDADFVAVPLTLVPSGDTFVAIAEHLQKCRAALQTAFTDPYRVSVQPRSFPSGDAAAAAADSTPTAASSATGGATLPKGMHFGLLIVRPLAQSDTDPEQVAFTILGKVMAVAATTPQCALVPGIYRLGLGDPERLRHDLLLRLERYTELSRISVPKPSKAWLSGLEAPLSVCESGDGRQVTVSLPFQLRFEESQ